MFLGVKGGTPLKLGVQKLGEKNVKMVQKRGSNVVQTWDKRGSNVVHLVDELGPGSGFPNVFTLCLAYTKSKNHKTNVSLEKNRVRTNTVPTILTTFSQKTAEIQTIVMIICV